jgi:hypothetical protein
LRQGVAADQDTVGLDPGHAVTAGFLAAAEQPARRHGAFDEVAKSRHRARVVRR